MNQVISDHAYALRVIYDSAVLLAFRVIRPMAHLACILANNDISSMITFNK